MSLLPAAVLLLTALSAPPPPLSLSAAETAVVAAGEIAVRQGDGPESQVIGLAYVAAPPPVVIDEVMNLAARVEEVGPIQSISRQDNGVSTSPGSYQALPYGAGSLLIYRVGGQGGSAAPAWLREILQTRSLREQVGGIRTRAEAH